MELRCNGGVDLLQVIPDADTHALSPSPQNTTAISGVFRTLQSSTMAHYSWEQYSRSNEWLEQNV